MGAATIQSIESLAHIAATSLISAIWQGIVLTAAAALFLRFVPRTTAAIRFTIWMALFLVLALLPILNSFSTMPTQTSGTHTPVVQLDIRWSFAIAALWALLSIVRALKLAIGALRLHGLWKRATPVNIGADFILPSTTKARAAQLCASSEVDRPSVIGFWSPRILIPEWLFEKLSPPELQQIVLHEMGHLRRADDWLNLIQKLGLVLFPLNPALLWIEKRLCFEREIACDDAVLKHTKAPKAYATCLTNLAERTLDRRTMSLSLGAWEKQSELSRRVHSILRRAESMSRPQAAAVLSVLILALVGGTTGLVHCPQLVSFSRTTAAISAEAQPSPSTEYHNVVFNPTAAPHATLLKASMPSVQPSAPALQTKPRQRRHTNPSPTQRVKNQPPNPNHWVVLTNWDASSSPKLIPLLADPQSFVFPYAAIATESGWLVIQL
jgi:beta-lactamase regulating signal transducer with metallopeptidase domain